MNMEANKGKNTFLKMTALILAVLCAFMTIRSISAKGEYQEKSTVIILQYADIGSSDGTTIEQLEADIQHMVRRGYTSVFVSDIARAIRKEGEIPKKSVSLTFDSLDSDSCDKVREVLEKYGYNGTVTINAMESEYASNSADDNNRYLRWSKVKELEKTGTFQFSTNGHSLKDNNNAVQGPGESYESFRDRIILDIDKTRELFLQNCGFEPVVFTYPDGSGTENFARVLRHMEFTAALTLDKGEIKLSGKDVSEPMMLERIKRSDIKDIWRVFI